MRYLTLFSVLLAFGAEVRADYADSFETLDGWQVWNPDNGFDVTIDRNDGQPSPAVHIAERQDSPGHVEGGFERRFDGVAAFYMAFDWRAFSSAPRHTSGAFVIIDANTGEELYWRDVLRGGLRDSQWQHFNATDLTHVLYQNGNQDARDILVRFVLRDGWVNRYDQHFLVDNFELIKSALRETTVVPLTRDDLSQGAEAWSFALPVTGCAHAMGMRWDESHGNEAPALLVEGSYTYTGNITCRYGMKRRIPVAHPFVLQFDWEMQIPERGSFPRLLTMALIGMDRRVLYTESFANDRDGFVSYRPFDLSGSLVGHDEVDLLIYGHASSDANEPSKIWVDNVAWTTPCEHPFMLYADPDRDGIGDPNQPHPAGAIWCYEMPGWSSDTGNCEDGPMGRDEDSDGYSLCAGDCDDNDATRSPADRDNDGFSTCAGDCDDNDDQRTPADHDSDGESSCDGDCDDADAQVNSRDGDGDGASACAGDCDDSDPALNIQDVDGDGVTTCDGDCDDRSWQIAPGLDEVPGDGVDNNCNGAVDEVIASTPDAGNGADAGGVEALPSASCGCTGMPGTGLELLLLGLMGLRRRVRFPNRKGA